MRNPAQQQQVMDLVHKVEGVLHDPQFFVQEDTGVHLCCRGTVFRATDMLGTCEYVED